MGVSKRILSCALTTVMLVSFCLSSASCKMKSSAAKKASDTEPWYTAARVELDPGFEQDRYNVVWPEGPYMCHDKYVMRYFVLEKDVFEGMDIDIARDLMGIFDQSGNLLSMIDLYDYMDEEKSEIPVAYQVIGFAECEKGIRLYYSDPYFVNAYYCDIDTETGRKVCDRQKIDISAAQDTDRTGTEKQYYSLRGVRLIEGYEVFEFDNSDFTRTKLAVAKDSEIITCIDLEKEFGKGEGTMVFNLTGIGNGKAMFGCFGKSDIWAEFDLSTGEVNEIPEGRPIPYDYQFSSTPDGKGYLTKATGIYEYDPESGEEKQIINFDNCDANRYESQDASVLSLDDDKVIIASQNKITSAFLLPSPQVIYTLEKADKNPNAGKTVITVASLNDGLSYAEAEALKIFNEQSGDYFARLILYGQSKYSSDSKKTDVDNVDRQRYSAMAMVSGNLILDIRSGTGPDVILGASQSVDLLNDSYLMDLTPYLESKRFDSSVYYSRIIEAAKIEGKTYYIPTAFTVTGIATDGSSIDNGRNGFTYDQYVSFVKQNLNGVEPVTYKSSRLHFLNLCVQNNYSGWLTDGKIDFNREEFREIASFFRENIPEGKIEEQNMWIYGDDKQEYAGATFIEDLYNISMLAGADYYGDKIRFMGLPSADGRGPSAKVYDSFSITEGSPVEDGAYAFLDILLSEDVQNNWIGVIPVNRAAAVYRCELMKADNLIGYKRTISFTPDLIEVSYQEDLRRQGLFDPATKLDEIYLEMLDNVDSIMIPDNSVLMIVSEEIPPYFVGQKDIDSVISVINSRTQVVFDER